MKNKNWIKSPWTISMGTAIFSLILTIGYDFSKKQPILSTSTKVLKSILSFVVSVLNFKLKAWWVLVVIIIIFISIYLIAKFGYRERLKPFCNYKEGKFKRWRWSWDWRLDNLRKEWCIVNLTAHCPKCDTPLIEHTSFYDGVSYDCPRCDFEASNSECDEKHKIERIILDNINRKGKNKN